MLKSLYNYAYDHNLTIPDSYVHHRNENICVTIGGTEKASVPATQIDSIVFWGRILFRHHSWNFVVSMISL